MGVIVGIATAAAAAMSAWNYLNGREDAAGIIVGIRQQTGVLAALVNMVNAVMDALLLIKRVSAVAPRIADGLPTFGMRVAEAA
jgi:hypothetical protein